MSAPTDAVYATLRTIFARVFEREQGLLDADATSQTIAGWDSFRYIEVIVELETIYGIELDGPEIDEVHTVGDLVRLVQHKTKENRSAI